MTWSVARLITYGPWSVIALPRIVKCSHAQCAPFTCDSCAAQEVLPNDRTLYDSRGDSEGGRARGAKYAPFPHLYSMKRSGRNSLKSGRTLPAAV
jgi:hypothetical protein